MSKKKKVVHNKWMRDLIPDHFTDLDYLFEETLFEGLIFFWEKDGGEASLELNSHPWDEEGFYWSPERKVCYDLMKAAYEWGKTRHESEPEYPDVGDNWLKTIRTDAYDEAVKIANEKMAKWEEEKDTHVTNILKYRKYLWT